MGISFVDRNALKHDNASNVKISFQKMTIMARYSKGVKKSVLIMHIYERCRYEVSKSNTKLSRFVIDLVT